MNVTQSEMVKNCSKHNLKIVCPLGQTDKSPHRAILTIFRNQLSKKKIPQEWWISTIIQQQKHIIKSFISSAKKPGNPKALKPIDVTTASMILQDFAGNCTLLFNNYKLALALR